jgi:hypothetical protein
MDQALSHSHEPATAEQLRKLAPALLRDALGLAGVGFWSWTWLNWLGSI